jgi:pimeloyl-ACP methyl ester carboxylesterase
MSAILLDDAIVHYEVLGRGRPVLFLHGWVGSWRYWISGMQALSPMYRTYALDLWGFGDTAKRKEGYKIEQQAQLVTQFLDRMGITRTTIVGHGLGAVVALMLAVKNPEIVDRVMAVETPMAVNQINARMFTGQPSELANWLSGRSLSAEPASQDIPKIDPVAISASISDLSVNNPVNYLQHNSIPCLLVYGLNDPAIILPQTNQLDSLPEHFNYFIFDQSGHFPMLDDSSRFNRLLIDFLSLPPGTSPRQLQLKEEWKRRVR